MSKKELILCFNKKQALELVEKTGNDAYMFLCQSSTIDQYFVPRYVAETSDELIHPIPYFAVINGEGNILLYQRGKGVGENRLSGKYSIGFGGHVELNKDCVDDYQACSTIEAISNAQTNESDEELDAEWSEDFTPMKVIYDPSDDVGKVHLGITSSIVVKTASTKEPELLDLGFFSKADLEKMQADGRIDLENWSKMLLAML